jgi:hypothetical protein
MYVFSLTIASSFDEILPGNTNSLIHRVTISRPVISDLLFKFGWPTTKSCDLFTTDRPYVTLYDTIYKKGSKQIWV